MSRFETKRALDRQTLEMNRAYGRDSVDDSDGCAFENPTSSPLFSPCVLFWTFLQNRQQQQMLDIFKDPRMPTELCMLFILLLCFVVLTARHLINNGQKNGDRRALDTYKEELNLRTIRCWHDEVTIPIYRYVHAQMLNP